MEVKCPVCDQLFPTSLIGHHAEHCLHSSFKGVPPGEPPKKRAISEVVDGSTEVASYPRKRQSYASHGMSVSSSPAAYYPKRGGGNSRGISKDHWNGAPSGSAPWNRSSAVSGSKPWSIGNAGSNQSIHGGGPKDGWRMNVSSASSVDSRSSIIKDHWTGSGGKLMSSVPKAKLPDTSSVWEKKRTVVNYPLPGTRNSVIDKRVVHKPQQFMHQKMTRIRSNNIPQERITAVSSSSSSTAAPPPKVKTQPPQTSPSALKPATTPVLPQTQHRKPTTLLDLLSPASFNDMVGNEQVFGVGSKLRRMLESGNISHLVICGPSGSGKSTIGNILFKHPGRYQVLRMSGATVTRTELLDVLSVKQTKTLFFIDDIQCLDTSLQMVCAMLLTNPSISFLATTSTTSKVCPQLLSRCELLHLSKPRPSDIQVLVQRVLKRARVVLNDDKSSTEKPVEQQFAVPNERYDNDESQTNSVNRSTIPSSNDERTIPVVVTPSNTGEMLQPEHTQKRQPEQDTTESNGGLAIEDMSDEEDESILDVLTKDLDDIGEDFIHEGEAFKDDNPLRSKKNRRAVACSLNDLDCVSDDELPDHKEPINLESIDSSEDEMDGDSPSIFERFRCVGVLREAVTYLALNCNGDIRVALLTLQSALASARKNAIYFREQEMQARAAVNASDNNDSKTATAAPPAATTGLVTDDISSDEDNVVSKPKVEDEHNLDNISDVSETSVHLPAADSPNNKNKSNELDSDDVFSDAMSPEMLDYGEIDEEVPEDATAEPKRSKVNVERNKMSMQFKESYKKIDSCRKKYLDRRKMFRTNKIYSIVTPEDIKLFLQSRYETEVSVEEASLREAFQLSITEGNEDGTVYWLGRLLHHSGDPQAIVQLLLKTAVYYIGVGDPLAVRVVMDCDEAIKSSLPLASDCHAALANTALYLARANKDRSAIDGLSAVNEHIKSTASALPLVPEHIMAAVTEQKTAQNSYKDDVEFSSVLPSVLHGVCFIPQ